MLHVWNIFQHLPDQNHPNVSKYTIHRAYGIWAIGSARTIYLDVCIIFSISSYSLYYAI